MTENSITNTSDRRSVFLSYALQDQATAQLLTLRLQQAGIDVWSGTNIEPGERLQEMVERKLRTSDYVIVLVSSAALMSRHFHNEVLTLDFVRELSDRSITLIPILLDKVELPYAIRDINYIDFRTDPRAAIEDLVSRLETVVDIDFSTLSAHEFEELVADLLVDLGFRAERDVIFQGRQFDFRIHFESMDPFGGSFAENWLIEVKHYSSGRLSVAVVTQFANIALAMRDQKTRIALVTSSQVTSAARDIIRQSPVLLIEGVELKRILLTRPDLVRRHFVGQRLK
jgi:hypothetical protein